MDTGLKLYRSYFPIKFGLQIDAKYGKLYPVFRKMMYPGDVFKIHADLLIRYQPMLAPPMNDCTATVRFYFVPLRLVEEEIELIMTGSEDGHLSTETLPICDSIYKKVDLTVDNEINKGSLMDILYQIPSGLVLNDVLKSKLETAKSSPAAYFAKAYARLWWDFYRDENLYTSYTDFETFVADYLKSVQTTGSILSPCLAKDRITASLPWQLKAAVVPRIEVVAEGHITDNLNLSWHENVDPVTEEKYGTYWLSTEDEGDPTLKAHVSQPSPLPNYPLPFGISAVSGDEVEVFSEKMNNQLETGKVKAGQDFGIFSTGFAGSDIRDVMSLTRTYERLARCGSRYTEFLRANFGVAPSDGTLQRAQYIGGFKTKIVTTEVIQTAGAGENPVGTLRGHGITHGMQTIKPFMSKEPGVLIGVLDIKPETIYAQGVDRELTARSRFDFLNPSFQHLSEQEVRKGEVYYAFDTDADGNLVNDQTWGFQPYAEELRKGIKHVAGEMRDSLSYWNQALIFGSRPSLNNAFISASSHISSYNRPFNVVDNTVSPMVVDFGGLIEAYRPLVKNGTPGLADHN